MKKNLLSRFLFLSLSLLLSLTASAGDGLGLSRKLATMRETVWAEWCDALARTDTLPAFPTNPLTEGRSMTWHLPDALEPHADMNFYAGRKGERPADGYPVYLYLHGSGPRDQEWATGLSLANRMFDDAPSAYIIPQIPNMGKYYRWWQQSKQWAWQHLLHKVLANPDNDPSRLYFFGISEGAYGSQRLASFYGDYLAGAGPMAGGEPLKNAPVENLGHVAFAFHTGDQDGMFYRHYLTQLTGQALDSIERLYPAEYHHLVELVPGRGHHIDYSVTTPWLSRHRRTAQPRHFVWENMEMDSVKRDNFYNLEVLGETDAYRTRYEFSARDNRIDLTVEGVEYTTTWVDPYWDIDMVFARSFTTAAHGHLRIYLSEQLVDLAQPVTIVVNGRTRYQGKVKVSADTMRRAVHLWGDPLRLFPSAVEVEW